MTPSQLYDQVRNLAFDNSLELSGETELYQYLSDAERILAGKIYCTPTFSTTPTVANQKEYTRPSSFKIDRVTWQSCPLKRIDLKDLDSAEGIAYSNTNAEYGNPVYYYEYGNTIGLSPTPATVQNLKFYFHAIPVALNSSSTTFTIPEEYAVYLADYALYRMFMKDQMKDQAVQSFQLWNANLMRCQSEWEMRKDSGRIEQVKLEECYPVSDMGMI